MIKSIGLTAAALFLSAHAFSAVTLSVPENIKLVAVNDQDIKISAFRSSGEYQLDAGQYAFGVRYQEFFQHADNSHDILKSAVVTIQTPELQDGQTYRLALLNAPKDFDAAQKYKQQPIVGVYNAANQLLSEQVAIRDKAQPLFGKSLTHNSVDLTTKNTTPVLANASQTIVANKVEAKDNKAVVSVGADQQLIQLWQKANKSERQKFMTWLADQAE